MKPLSYPLPQFKFILMINFLQMNKITGHIDPESVLHNAVFYIKVFKFPKDPVSPLINISSSHCVPNWLNFMILPLMPHIIFDFCFLTLKDERMFYPQLCHEQSDSKPDSEPGVLELIFIQGPAAKSALRPDSWPWSFSLCHHSQFCFINKEI